MFCCPDCFNNDYLKRHIETFSNKNGICSFCNKSNVVPILESVKLMDLFQPVIDLYQVSADGLLLIDFLQKDWHIFSETISIKHQEKLLSEIMDDVSVSKRKVEAYRTHENRYIQNWGDFTKELQHKNRFFPQKAIREEILIKLLNFLVLDKNDIPNHVFRARLNSEDSPYNITKMGKPPEDKVPDGRANPKGISYFYGASDELTAISETRPYKSEIVYVASFNLNNEARLVDLREPQQSISPFGHEDDLFLVYTEYIPFLTQLSEMLSIPVLPDKKDFEYLPTQYLCELIKKIGFSGILFKSSLGKGDNFVIFDNSLLSGQIIEVYRNEDITFNPVKIKL